MTSMALRKQLPHGLPHPLHSFLNSLWPNYTSLPATPHTLKPTASSGLFLLLFPLQEILFDPSSSHMAHSLKTFKSFLKKLPSQESLPFHSISSFRVVFYSLVFHNLLANILLVFLVYCLC